jgi:predicted metallo-beta-lactamase superfamily hydrolase
MFYFDNQPKQYYGTIRQQLWSVLHFFLHIAIVLVVEGSQQVVLAHHVLRKWEKFIQEVKTACNVKELDSEKLTEYLTSAVAPYALADKPETRKLRV